MRAAAPKAAHASPLELSAAASVPGKGFPRRVRLTKPGEYQRVFAGAKRSGDRYFTVLAAPAVADHARLGMAVSRRNAPRAVDRNRIKRVVRESFREHLADLRPQDLVVIAKPAAKQASKEELRRALEKHWQRFSR